MRRMEVNRKELIMDNEKDIQTKYFNMMEEILVLDVRIIKGESHLQEEKDKKLSQAIYFKMKHNLY